MSNKAKFSPTVVFRLNEQPINATAGLSQSMAQQQLGRRQQRAASMIAQVRISENLLSEHEGERRDERANEAASRLRAVARTAAAVLAPTSTVPAATPDATAVEGTNLLASGGQVARTAAAVLAPTTAAPAAGPDAMVVEGITFFSWQRDPMRQPPPSGRPCLSHIDAE